jgi:hypothetical protein
MNGGVAVLQIVATCFAMTSKHRRNIRAAFIGRRRRLADTALLLDPGIQGKPTMNTRTLALASTVIIAAAGAALADDMTPNDFTPPQTTRHISQQGYSVAPGSRNASGPVRGIAGPVQEVPTYLLPRELQWMNRPQNLSNGANR